MKNDYTAPQVEVIGSLHDLTQDIVKIIGGNLDGVFLKAGGKKIPLGTS